MEINIQDEKMSFENIQNEIQSWIAVNSEHSCQLAGDAFVVGANELAEFVNEVFKKLEGCVVVPVELSESIAEKLALEKVEKPRQENDVVWQEIADHSYKDHLIQKKWEIIRNYKELVEAVRGGNE